MLMVVPVLMETQVLPVQKIIILPYLFQEMLPVAVVAEEPVEAVAMVVL